MPLLDSVARDGEPFFQSLKRKWVPDDDRGIPSGDWQLAPSSIKNPYQYGGDVSGEAVYSAQDRNLTSTSAPIVTGIMAVAGDKDSCCLEAGDLVTISPYYGSRDQGVHTVKKVTVGSDTTKPVAVVASFAQLGMRGSSPVSISVTCCGPVKLLVNNIINIQPGLLKTTNMLHPGEMFKIGSRNFIVMTPANRSTIYVRCLMGNKQ